MTQHNEQTAAIRVTREARGRVSGDGVQLAFGYWPGRGAPVVALHGLTASYVNFIGIAERLAGRSPLLGLDLRGRGDSDKPAGPYGFAQHAHDVAAAMRAMKLGPSVVIGHSMGGFVAAALAAQEPALVSALVLIDGGYLPAITGGAPNESLNAALAERVMQLTATFPSRQAYREYWRAKPHFPPADWNPWAEAFLDYEVAGESPVQPKAFQAGVVADLAEGFRRDEMAERLRAIRVPVILIRAERGFLPDQPPLFPDALAAQIRALVPQLEDHKIPGTTHYTIVLGERGASTIADLIQGVVERTKA
jgi:lipase